ncbi:MAG: methyl-accepting chemotaxis protein [Desulfobacterales bacterium]|nr:methyl-accepting chemotaxis protein [Desulfobacterales bacterium]
MFIKLTLGRKIGGGYAIISLILAAAVLTTIYQVRQTTEVTDRVMSLRVPTSQSSLSMLNGVNRSMAALRGWIILGQDQFRDERTEAWSQGIEPSLQALREFSKDWTNPENIKRLDTLESKLAAFKNYQREIEDIAHTRENQPALKIMFDQAAPQALIITTQITNMIEIEKTLEANAQRKALLGMMADVRGTTGLALANLRTYLLSGEDRFKSNFDTIWEKNTRRFDELSSNVALMTPEQAAAYDTFKEARDIFVALPPKMFAIRSGDEWNLANAWLGSKAAPTAFTIKDLLGAMVSDQQNFMASDMNEAARLTRALETEEWVILVVGLIVCAVLGFVLTRVITLPIQEAVGVAGRMATGDLSKEIHSRSADETGLLLDSMENMRQGLLEIFTDLKSESDSLVSSSGGLIQISGEMSENASEVTGKSGTVATAAEEMSSNMSSVAAAVEEAGTNVSMVADASGQMAQTIEEIAGNSEKARGTTADAVAQARRAAARMEKLGTAAHSIGRVTEAINDISEQTNLLALNATIEAARAGESGKGFAVVAGEIKDLARQTAEATSEIREKIEGIQSSTTSTVEDIDRILKIIQEVNDIVSVIASSVEEQTVTTREIAANVSQASEGIQEITRNVAQSSSVSGEVAKDIADVDQSSGEISNMSRGISGSAEELRELAGRLNGVVSKFKLDAAA